MYSFANPVGHNGAKGDFQLDVGIDTPAPTTAFAPTQAPTTTRTFEAGCLGATEISFGTPTLGSTVNEPYYFDVRTCDGATDPSTGTWYRVTAETSGTILASLCNNIIGSFDSELSVWTGSCAALECVGMSLFIRSI